MELGKYYYCSKCGQYLSDYGNAKTHVCSEIKTFLTWNSETEKQIINAFKYLEEQAKPKHQDLDPCEREIMSYCNDLMNRMLGKYRRGRAEHGSNWQGIDCDKEISEEVKDILNYHCIFKTQKVEI